MSEPRIHALAGVNGSGKSSIGGAAIAARGVHYYNPDTAAQELRKIHPNMTQPIANGHARGLGREMLVKAVEKKRPSPLKPLWATKRSPTSSSQRSKMAYRSNYGMQASNR